MDRRVIGTNPFAFHWLAFASLFVQNQVVSLIIGGSLAVQLPFPKLFLFVSYIIRASLPRPACKKWPWGDIWAREKIEVHGCVVVDYLTPS